MSKPLKINLILLSIAVLILVGKIYNLPKEEVRAQTPSDVSYGVVMNNDTGYLGGFAWSENIGWIKFGGLSSFPVGAGTQAQNAQIVSGKLIGWARACEGTVSGDCSTMTSRTDGWDGWISLGGVNYDVSYDNPTQDFSGYAWGSDLVGWISFVGDNYGVKLSSIIVTDIIIDPFYASDNTIIENSSTTIIWDSVGADSCDIKRGSTIIASGISGSQSSGLLSTTTTFTAVCKNVGNQENRSITVFTSPPPPPVRRITPEPGEIDWEVTDGISCVLKKDGVIVGEGISGTYTDDTLEADIMFTLECDVPEAEPLVLTARSVPPTPKSTCTPTQSGNAEGDNNLYVNRSTTWTLTNNIGSPGSVVWSGTNISSPVTTPGNQLNKIYTTVGTKIINATTTITRSSDGTTYTSTCSTSTLIKLDSGSSGEI